MYFDLNLTIVQGASSQKLVFVMDVTEYKIIVIDKHLQAYKYKKDKETRTSTSYVTAVFSRNENTSQSSATSSVVL